MIAFRAVAVEALGVAALAGGLLAEQALTLHDLGLSPEILPWAGAGLFAALSRMSFDIYRGTPTPPPLRAAAIGLMSVFVGVLAGTVAKLVAGDGPLAGYTVWGVVMLAAFLSEQVLGTAVALGDWASAQAIPTAKRWLRSKVGEEGE